MNYLLAYNFCVYVAINTRPFYPIFANFTLGQYLLAIGYMFIRTHTLCFKRFNAILLSL